MTKPEIELTAAEWTIIKAVWENEPCAAPDIQEKLFSKRIGLFHRAHDDGPHGRQGPSHQRKNPHLSLFRSAVTPAQARRGELAYALKHAFDGALTPMVQCLLETNDLTREELAGLESLIKARKEAGKKRTAPQPSTQRKSK